MHHNSLVCEPCKATYTLVIRSKRHENLRSRDVITGTEVYTIDSLKKCKKRIIHFFFEVHLFVEILIHLCKLLT